VSELAVAQRRFAEAVGQGWAFGREGVEAEFGSCLVDGVFGVAEVGAVRAVRGGAEGAAVVVWGDVVAVAVDLDGGDSAFPCGAGGVVFGSGAEDGGDVVRRVDLGGGDKLAFGLAVARQELLFKGAEVADLVGVAVDPGDGVVFCPLRRDLIEGVAVAAVDVGRVRLEVFELAAKLVAFGTASLEEPERVELMVGLPYPEFGVFELCSLALGVVGEALERACLPGGEVVERLADAVVLVSNLRGGQRACARVRGFVGGEGLSAAVAQVAGKPRDGVLGCSGGPWARSWSGRSVWAAR
jgi:hypothetical protein